VRTDGRVRRALPAAASAVAVAAAATIWHHLPTPLDVYGPFDVHGTLGRQVVDRSFEVTVTAVRIGPRARARPRPAVTAVGEWVVVDAEVAARTRPARPTVELQVGPNTYISSDRFVVAPLGLEVAPGIPQRGSWVFDVAPDVLDAADGVTLRLWQGDGRLDSRLVVDIPVGAGTPRADPVLINPVEVGT
jgi:hypothetical protein